MPPPARERLLSTGAGSNTEAFRGTDWALLAAIALIWGASFLLIELALRAFAPGIIVWGRIGFGALTLACVPQARKTKIATQDYARIVVLGLVWMAIPLTLFPIAQQWVDSAVPGMINGGMPLMTALWAGILTARLPGRIQMIGLIIGFIGILAIFIPEIPAGVGDGTPYRAIGVGLSIGAIFCYGLAANLAVPLQQRYGSPAVLLRAQGVALVAVTPYGAWSLHNSTFTWPAMSAVAVLGVLGTGLAFVMMANLVGSVGGPRGSTAIYFVPVVAITLGVVILGETVHPLAVFGTLLALIGAWLTSRRERLASPATLAVSDP